MDTTATQRDTVLTRRITGRWLRWARVVWSILAAIAVTLFVMSLPLTYADRLGQAYNFFSEALPEIGLTPQFYAAYFPAIQLIHAIIGVTLGVFVMLRRSDEPIALIVSLALVVTSTQNGGGFNAWQRGDPAAAPLLVTMYALSYVLIFANLLLFPDGRFYPPWTRWIMLGILPLTVLDGLATVNRPASSAAPASPFLIVMGLIGFVALYAQVRRFRRGMTPTQRQQVKWVLFGLFVSVVPITLFNLIDPFVTPWFAARPPLRVLYRFFIHLFLLYVPFTSFSVALAISIFRYRLWDIDYAINRSLGYALVSAALVILFLILFVLLQSLITNPITLALLAIGVGLLFNPLRKRIQRVIDKRVYGLRYAIDAVAAHGRSGTVTAQRPANINPAPAIVHRGSFSGQMLGGYLLGDLVGRGGMGEVYKGHLGDQTLAVKLLAGMSDAETRVRFARESAILERLKHPNIVTFYEYGESDAGLRYMVMDYLDGVPLDKYIKSGASIGMDTIRLVLRDISDALDYVHARGVVHRDLKPANIMLMLREDKTIDRAILMDFGIAKSATTAITGTETMGTIDYMAPEQIQAAANVDARADIYALGIMLYEMVTGARPFQGNAGQVLFAHLRQPPPDMHVRVPDLSQAVIVPILRALSKAPDDRYDHAGDLAAALAA